MLNCFAGRRAATCLSAKLPWGLFEYLLSASCADIFRLLDFKPEAATIVNTEVLTTGVIFLTERSDLLSNR